MLPRLARPAAFCVGLSPFLADLFHRADLHRLAWPLDLWFTLQCERDPARTAAWLGQGFPVCVRCAGIYVGLAAGALILRPRLGFTGYARWLVVASLVMIVDVATEQLGLRGEQALVRTVTGLALGYALGAATGLARTARGGTTSTLRPSPP